MSVWGSQGLVVKEMVVGKHQQLVMVWVHLLPPYTAAGGGLGGEDVGNIWDCP